MPLAPVSILPKIFLLIRIGAIHCFMVLMLAEGFLMPYQCSYYLSFQSQNQELKLYDQGALLRFNLWTHGIRLAAVYASIPFWRMLGILQ